MTENQYPNPFGEAIGQAWRESKQAAYAAVVLAGACMRWHARSEQRRLILNETARQAAADRERAARDAVRAQWEPACDRKWLRSAGPVEVADTWCAAVPYADPGSDLYGRSAELAVDNCESRLRELHPYAMNHYDRLRDEGLGRLEAMREAAPLFLNEPHARPHTGNARLAINTQGLNQGADEVVHGPSREGFEQHVAQQQTLRGSRIVERMQVRALAQDRPLLDPDEQRTALEQATNLPPEIIGQVVPAASPPVPRPARRAWENDFPFSIEEVVHLAAQRREPPDTPEPRRAPARQPGRAPHA